MRSRMSVVSFSWTLAIVLLFCGRSDAESLKLNAKNTRVGFVGTKPDGKHEGGFKALAGTVDVGSDPTSAKLNVTVDATSLWSDNPKLTGHLKSPDFFGVRRHPTAKFVSSKIVKSADKEEYKVTGDLTLLGVTKKITFPAKISTAGREFKLSSYFKIDRTQFGMNYGIGKVDKEVSITVTVKAAK